MADKGVKGVKGVKGGNAIKGGKGGNAIKVYFMQEEFSRVLERSGVRSHYLSQS